MRGTCAPVFRFDFARSAVNFAQHSCCALVQNGCAVRHSGNTAQQRVELGDEMSTNVELDENLVARARHATGIRSKRALIDAGLRALLRLHEQREIRDLRGRLRWEESEGVPGVQGKS